ncbi:MAG: hypothetical protein R3236_04790, partial [Phycisphaeraceae bacterium]|nr:hypothetical protein [Phycisphaeraceae bacterium]
MRTVAGLLWVVCLCPAALGSDEPTRLRTSGPAEQIGRAIGTAQGPVLAALHGPFLKTAMAVTGQSRRQLYRRAAAISESI